MCEKFSPSSHRVSFSSLRLAAMEQTEQKVLGWQPEQSRPKSDFLYWTQQSRARAEYVSPRYGVQNIHPHKCLSRGFSIHSHLPHIQSSGGGERRAPCVQASLPAAFCLHSVRVLYWLDTNINISSWEMWNRIQEKKKWFSFLLLISCQK